MLSTCLASVVHLATPSFATRVRWAIEEHDQGGLEELRAEDPAAFALLLTQQRSDSVVTENSRVTAVALARQRREAHLLRSKVAITDAMRAAIIAGSLAHTEALQAVRSWWEQRPTPWLVLSGRPDSGKSVAAASGLAENGGLWMSSNELVLAYAGLFGEAALAQQQAKAASLLVIDELGAEDDAARMASALLQLLNSRNSACRTPVIATTNLTFEVLVRRYANDRVRSRLNELVSWVPISPANLRPMRPQLFIPKQEAV